ncbi:hypothetical protein [Dyadobacter sandarakinus]|uniref:Uncharacterized protein n=1 Tax=Dyadobacter sandarakinus TaxID=2747268 RepID=A0ABX7I5C4_9BACT|nr:hypothetical protein [Dyadobacter sandarakinus]QRR00742.1 hypothetical protein HWI92_07405 [Dyadobacter sandarakinus]
MKITSACIILSLPACKPVKEDLSFETPIRMLAPGSGATIFKHTGTQSGKPGLIVALYGKASA